MTTQDLIKRLRNLGPLGKIMEELVIVAADRLEELQRLNDSMQVDRDLWIKVGREKLEAVERERDEARAEVERLLNLGHAAARARDEYRDEVKRLTKELEDSTNHYNRLHDLLRGDVERLKQELHDAGIENSGQAAQLERTRPEPSRLEIAAMLMAGSIASPDACALDAVDALEMADALIAAAREGK